MQLISNKKEPNHIIGSAQVYGRASLQNVTYIGHFTNRPCTSLLFVARSFTSPQIKPCDSGAVS
jgi:hypothetical protein